jgi:Raf kinase inhibitor-like YbhB/YbcL family protein
MKLSSAAFNHDSTIPERYGFGKYDAATHFTLSDNVSPDLTWTELPAGTKSLVLLCMDPDVPSVGDDVNQEGKTVSANLPRVEFCHWALVDLDPLAGGINEGEFSKEVTAKGKSGPGAAGGTRQGLNDFTKWFAGDADMGGDYYGYDGPAPPWNDELVHDYHFTLYALDVERCAVEGTFTAEDVKKAIEGHVLGEARLTGRYAINPDAK